MATQVKIHQVIKPSVYRWSHKLNKLIPNILQLSIYLLIWNLKSRLDKNKTKFLQARIDACADVNIMPVSICKYLFKDPDCAKIAPSDFTVKNIHQQEGQAFRILQPLSYTSRYKMYHRSDILCSQQWRQYLDLMCKTSLDLGLIKPHDRLDHLPPEGNVIFSSADKLMDESWLKVPMLLRKPKLKSSNERLLFVFQWWTI